MCVLKSAMRRSLPSGSERRLKNPPRADVRRARGRTVPRAARRPKVGRVLARNDLRRPFAAGYTAENSHCRKEIAMETYDIVMLAVLGLATLFGFLKGFAWQVASLASLILS
jgi:hypothetical protein